MGRDIGKALMVVAHSFPIAFTGVSLPAFIVKKAEPQPASR
jgi:hypothetical protein